MWRKEGKEGRGGKGSEKWRQRVLSGLCCNIFHFYQGPFVKMDPFLQLLETVNLGANAEGAAGGGGSTTGAPEEKVGLKRKRENGEDDDLLRVPPVNDIYRSRQQKRVHA